MVNDHCPYAGNAFCASLPSETRGLLCEHCHIRIYPKGMLFPQSKWKDRFAILAQGLMALGQFDQPERPSSCQTTGIACNGTLLSVGPLYSEANLSYSMFFEMCNEEENWENICIEECHVATFDSETIRALYRSDIGFVQNLFWASTCTCAYEGELFMQAQTSAYSSVKYVLDFCRRNQVPELTHAQIALICNRARPVVTNEIHAILQESQPE